MKYLKHKFIFKLNNIFILEGPNYLTPDWSCSICGKTVKDMFLNKSQIYSDFGNVYEQEKWLNKNVACLTIEEKMIKELLE